MQERTALEDQLTSIGRIERELEDNIGMIELGEAEKDRAVVTIEPIQESRKARVTELARMLGDSKAKSALAHAEELLGK